MNISRLDARQLRLPPAGPVSLPLAGGVAASRTAIDVLLVQVETNAGTTGIGFGPIAGGGRSLLAAIEDDLGPILIGENALNHERLWAKAQALNEPVVQRAHAFIDIALWDLKGKAAGLPLWRLLGGARESAKTFTAETAPAQLSADEVIAVARAAMAKGIKGIRVGIHGIDPEAESRKIVAVRDALGEEIWFAVSVESPYDYETALPMARFLEEEVGADWFEDPLADDNLAGYAMLASRTDTPLAAGGSFASPAQFLRLLETKAPVMLRPDVIRIGGITPWLKVAALAELHRRPIVPRLLPEISVHLACGLPGVAAVEYLLGLAPLLVESPKLVDGRLQPPPGAGLDLELNSQAVAKYTLNSAPSD
jgi:L-alanine-DL-glutamate epimerase-like enolase superfamily enzyme